MTASGILAILCSERMRLKPERERAMKKKWKKPELVVLARLKRGESVLQGCKRSVGTGPTNPCYTGGPRCLERSTT